MFSIKKLFSSSKWAFSGLRFSLKENSIRAWIFLVVVTVAAGFFFSIERLEWVLTILLLGQVGAMEIANTHMEELVDFLHPEPAFGAKKAKDLAAGATLITVVVCAVGLVLIFFPYVLELFNF